MAPVELEVRVAAGDTLKFDFDADQTVEALSVDILKRRPDIGGEIRLVHKGKVLKPEQVLVEVGVKSGDAVAVAKMPSSRPQTAPTPTPHTTVPSTTVAATADAAPGACPSPPASTSQAENEAVEVPHLTSEAPDAKRPKHDGNGEAQPAQDAPTPATSAGEEALAGHAEVATANAEPAGTGTEQCNDAEAATAMDIDASSASGLLEFAKALEAGKMASPPPAQLAVSMRQASQKIEELEDLLSKLSQGMQMVNMVSAHTLRELIARNGGVDHEAPAEHSPDAHPGAQHADSTRSFLLKRGDAETHELHRAAAALGHGAVSCGGLASSSAAPLTKEEMDKARRARLAKLEEQQALKKKEKEEAEEKGKAREAMFNRPFVGTQKPLGKH